jgi:hypothetical protein
MKKQGRLTAKLGDYLEKRSRELGFTIYYDHGERNSNVGKIAAHLGAEPHKDSCLAQIDIALLDGKKRVRLLVEVEESGDRPKTIIGDAMTILLSDKVSYKNKNLHIGEWTQLLIISKKSIGDHADRMDEIEKRINRLIQNREYGGINIKDVKLEYYENEGALFQIIEKYIDGLK